MTILSVAQDVCKVIGLEVPDVFVTSTDREHVELLGVANEMAERIASSYSWQLFSRVATVTGDGSDTDFALPSDYHWMTDEAQLWSSSLETPLSRVKDRNEWLGLEVQSFDFVVNAWIIYGGELHIKPALASGVTAKYFYQSNLWFQPSSGANKKVPTADSDSFRLSERLLKLGIIWQWKANKGQPYGEDMANYEDALSKEITRDKGAKKLIVGNQRIARGASIAYPLAITP